MGIFVIDQGPELFWFVNNALLETEIAIKHYQTLEACEEHILKELPQIVVLNACHNYPVEKFINKMRNHVFARNTIFIVFTSNTSDHFKKNLLISGAAQIFYIGMGHNPSPKFLGSYIKWCLSSKAPNANIFDYKPVSFDAEAELRLFGRMGWVSSSHCMIETNLELNPGQSIEFTNLLFGELKIKDVKLQCIERNKVGRYYQYSNSVLCKIIFNDPGYSRVLGAWIQANQDISINKSIKLVYFEDDYSDRANIKQMIKMDKRYCARGYNSIQDITEVLEYQIPHLVLINRALIRGNKKLFEKIKPFMKNHFCHCVTYDTGNDNDMDIAEFKKNYDFALHSPTSVDLPLLESMIQKLEAKLPTDLAPDKNKIYFDKHSKYSRITLHSPAKLTEIATNGGGIILPFVISNFGACEISCQAFNTAMINRNQFFRVFSSQNSSNGVYHFLIFMGQSVKDNLLVKEAVEKIETVGFEKWVNGEF